jgi:L-lysine 2,3-aminomutase
MTVSKVFPFRVNNYVMEELIDWDNIPDDPIFRLTFPQSDMLEKHELDRMQYLLENKAPEKEIQIAAQEIQMGLNPHPAGQMDMNVPVENGKAFKGIQHKYKETVLFFPSHGQTCHAYCTYCFRWPQFVGLDKLKFASREIDMLVDYLSLHPEVTDVLFTGGDPLTMNTKILRRYIEPLLREKPGNLTTFRIGTKVPAFWPYRFLSDKDSDDLMSLFEQIIENGIHLAIMSHFCHPRELEPPAAQDAIKQILNTGAAIRCQAPLIRYVNDDPEVWSSL